MLIIQCLLAAIALILIVGFGIVVAYLHDLHQNQNRGAAAQLDYLSRILGTPNEGEASHLIRDLSRFLKMVEGGQYPNLRHDAWVPTKADMKRWENAENDRAYLDR
jgi:hypothetical protein